MPAAKIPRTKRAKMLTQGLDALMEKKRKSAPHLHTKEFTSSVMAFVRKVRTKKSPSRVKSAMAEYSTKRDGYVPKKDGYAPAEITVNGKAFHKRTGAPVVSKNHSTK